MLEITDLSSFSFSQRWDFSPTDYTNEVAILHAYTNTDTNFVVIIILMTLKHIKNTEVNIK